MNAENKVVKTILCIPGFWESYPLGFIENGNEKFLAVSYGLMDVVNKRTYWLELCDHDNRMRKSFEVAGRVTGITEKFLEEVDKHTSVMYMTGETGNFDDARFIAKAVFALLSTGGIGVKVETTGKAFTKDKWVSLTDGAGDADMYELFVLDSLMQQDGTTYSCGMHNIGLKDTIISNLEFDEAQRLVRIFNYFQVIDKPVIKNKETFKTDINAPRFRIVYEPNQVYTGDKLFETRSECGGL